MMKSILTHCLSLLIALPAVTAYDKIYEMGETYISSIYAKDHYIYAGTYKIIKKWDTRTDTVVQTFSGGHTGYVRTLYVSESRKYFISGSSDYNLVRWDEVTGTPLFTIETGYFCYGVYTDDQYYWSGSLYRYVKKWSLDGTLLAQYNLDFRSMYVIPFNYILVGGRDNVDGSIKLLDYSDLTELRTFQGPVAGMEMYGVAKSGSIVYAGGYTSGSNPNVFAWDFDSGNLLFSQYIGVNCRNVITYHDYAILSQTSYGATMIKLNETSRAFSYSGYTYMGAVVPPYVYFGTNLGGALAFEISEFFPVWSTTWSTLTTSFTTSTTVTSTLNTTTVTLSTSTSTSTVTTTTFTSTTETSTSLTTTIIRPSTTAPASTNPASFTAKVDAEKTTDSTIIILGIAAVVLLFMCVTGYWFRYSLVARRMKFAEEQALFVQNMNTQLTTATSMGPTAMALNQSVITTLSHEFSTPGFLQAELGRDYIETEQVDEFEGQVTRLVTPMGIEVMQRAMGTSLAARTYGPAFEELPRSQQDGFNHELKTMWQFRDHSGFAKVFGYSLTPATLIIKHYPEGNLHQLVAGGRPVGSSKIEVTNERITAWLKQIGIALNHLHQNGIVHLDIRPANFLLESEYGAAPVAVLSGFALARSMDKPAKLRHYQLRPESIRFSAPDLIERFRNRKDDKDPNIWIADDVYSFSMSIYQLVNGK